MDHYLRSLKINMLRIRRQIVRENSELQKISSSLNNDTTEVDIKNSVNFMKANMDKLVEASTKLEQLEEVYSSLMYVQKHEK